MGTDEVQLVWIKETSQDWKHAANESARNDGHQCTKNRGCEWNESSEKQEGQWSGTRMQITSNQKGWYYW